MIHSKVFTIPLLGAYMKKMGQIRVIPGEGEQVLEEARRTLASGRSVVIFPEGLISPVDRFHEPRSGVAHLTLQSKVPVVLLGIYLREKNCKRVPTSFEGEPTSSPGACAARMPSPSARPCVSPGMPGTGHWSGRLQRVS